MESDWLCSIKTLMFLWEEKEQMSVLPSVTRVMLLASDIFWEGSLTLKTPGMGLSPGWLVYPNIYFSEWSEMGVLCNVSF